MDSLNYHHLLYFWMVCKEGGFTRAAARLGLSQSAISEQVARLEESLDHRLIERTTRSFTLTETGTVVLNYAEAIFSTGKELADFVRHRPISRVQVVRVGAVGGMSRNLQIRFLSPLFDREDARFTVTAGDSKRLLRLLREHSLDIVLSAFPASEEEAGSFYTHLIAESPLCIVTARRHRSMKGSLEKLLTENKVYLPSSALESRADFDHFIEKRGIRLRVAGEVDDMALLRLLALSGKGVVVVPRMGVVNDIENRGLIELYQWDEIRQRFYAITRQKKFPNPLIGDLVRAFK